MVIADSKVIVSERSAFGGSRIAGGQSSADLWSDGVVLGAAWSTAQPELGGQLFSFRGTLAKRYSWSRVWTLRDVNDVYVGEYATRKAALIAVVRLVQMDAFRELNRVERDR